MHVHIYCPPYLDLHDNSALVAPYFELVEIIAPLAWISAVRQSCPATGVNWLEKQA